MLKQGVSLEISSSFDIDLILRLHQQGKIDRNITILCNGFKPKRYLDQILQLIQAGFKNVIPICDNAEEIDYFETHISGICQLGLRVATEEEPKFEFYTSRLGIRGSDVLELYRNKIKTSQHLKLKLLHFFVDTGIKDSLYYWGELRKALKLYCELKKESEDLHAIDIGGGLPIRNSLGFEFDYKYMVRGIVGNILHACRDEGVPEPDIFTEFGKYTVGESSALIYSVIAQKQQNDSEMWYMIDSSLMTTIPDAWGIGERFILLPINKWDREYRRVNIGGLSCDNADYYNSETHESRIYLPAFDPKEEEPLYIGFFHTGAYQDAISGYGGVKHCLIPSPRRILIDRTEEGHFTYTLYQEEQRAEDMLKILGYQD